MAKKKNDETKLEKLLLKYLENGQVIAIGTSDLGEKLLRKLSLQIGKKDLDVTIVPTSFRFTALLHDFKLPRANINEHEIDVAVQFADCVDKEFNFVKKNSTSLVRDKMIAMSALELITVVEEKDYVNRLERWIPMEVVEFGLKKSIIHLDNLGKAVLRLEKSKPVKTETGNYIVDVLVDKVYSLDDIEIESKRIPGVIETGLFLGYADRVILRKDHEFKVKSRIRGE
jgi:ribose 5-phosphate isomerase A